MEVLDTKPVVSWRAVKKNSVLPPSIKRFMRQQNKDNGSMKADQVRTSKGSKTWLDILDEVRDWQRPIQENGHPIWYRGQSDSTWFARSGLHRHILNCFEQVDMSHDQPWTIDLLRDVYATLYYKFKGRAWRFLEQSERSPWGIMFSMQHYGLPTLLLDWTESFACALYFVQQGRDPECDAALYLLNPQVLNSQSLTSLEEFYKEKQLPLQRMIFGEGLISLGDVLDPSHYSSYFHPEHPLFRQVAPAALRTVAVAPFFSNPRMLAQRAAFTLSGMSFTPVEQQFGEDVVKRITLPANTYSDARDFLDLVGISHFGYFPDITNLVRGLKDEMDKELDKAIQFANGQRPSQSAAPEQ
jgi:hypothetical protein